MGRGGVGRSALGLFLVSLHLYKGSVQCFIVYRVFNTAVNSEGEVGEPNMVTIIIYYVSASH